MSIGAPRRRRIAAVGAALLALASATAVPHEVETNRLMLVQREPQHLALTFYVDYVGLLGRLLAPSASRAQFAGLCAAMPDERLQHQLRLAHSMFEGELDLRTASGERLRVSPLRWPEFPVAQRLLRDAAMSAITDPSRHEHGPPLEITADALSVGAANAVHVTLPRSLGTVIVVWYRPMQREVSADRGQSFEVRY